ncbi:cellulose biosynthesis protein BcsD [Undibacterium squillarum]|uniref:Cellulose synthase subunit D n=1 Tax=Undibacterium squillarum TaxID=1131567 RepID=A0ABQ2XZG9_9BURK|nr:cellulose biosynthesis protein BcsD [Undibacterium squillarum]GGX44133.1 hypothetical protein GCM10010946_23360 [Undibacterium squillarum]
MSQQRNRYIENLQVSRQWQFFLKAFAQEFSQKGDVRELRLLMHRLGRRMATMVSVTDGSSLQALEDAMNRVWTDMNWGCVELSEQADALLVLHQFAPLRLAFGPEASVWTPALLEGIYAQWFEALGMDSSLRLTQRGNEDEDCLLVFELKRVVDEFAFIGKR